MFEHVIVVFTIFELRLLNRALALCCPGYPQRLYFPDESRFVPTTTLDILTTVSILQFVKSSDYLASLQIKTTGG